MMFCQLYINMENNITDIKYTYHDSLQQNNLQINNKMQVRFETHFLIFINKCHNVH